MYRKVRSSQSTLNDQARIVVQADRFSDVYSKGGSADSDDEYLALCLEFNNGIRLKGAVDTGCLPDGAISLETVKRLSLESDLYEEFTPVLAANNVEIDATQVLKTEVKAGKKATIVNLIVMDLSVDSGILIGKPTLQRLGLCQSLEDALKQADQELNGTLEMSKNY